MVLLVMQRRWCWCVMDEVEVGDQEGWKNRQSSITKFCGCRFKVEPKVAVFGRCEFFSCAEPFC